LTSPQIVNAKSTIGETLQHVFFALDTASGAALDARDPQDDYQASSS
jgi:hypothetical protein